MIVFGMALVLDAVWALLPAFLATVDLVARTLVEDRFLHDNLTGYRDFAKRTRCRLIPGIW
jgi:protein-S-isoprenylcysteine O-methyltransferase Ste14